MNQIQMRTAGKGVKKSEISADIISGSSPVREVGGDGDGRRESVLGGHAHHGAVAREELPEVAGGHVLGQVPHVQGAAGRRQG